MSSRPTQAPVQTGELLNESGDTPLHQDLVATLRTHLAAAGLETFEGAEPPLSVQAAGAADGAAWAPVGPAGRLSGVDAARMAEVMELVQQDVQRLVKQWEQQNKAKLLAVAAEIWQW